MSEVQRQDPSQNPTSLPHSFDMSKTIKAEAAAKQGVAKVRSDARRFSQCGFSD